MLRTSQALGRHVRANLVAYVALFSSLGLGSAWAATELSRNAVKSRHIQNAAVKRQDLARNSVNSAKVVDGSLRPRDLAAAARGPQGAPGPPGPPGITGREMVFESTGPPDSVSGKVVTAKCPPGKRVLGGGAMIENGFSGIPGTHVTHVAITAAATTEVNNGFTAWAVEIPPGTTENWALQARAVCAEVG